MKVEDRFNIIKRNTQEIVSEQELLVLLNQKKQPSVYLGWSITGRPHIGYYVPVLKLADFLKAGFKVKLLLADLHGALDKTPWEVLDKRYKYYAATIPLMFKSLGVNINNFEIVKGSDYQLSPDYFQDLLKLCSFTTEHDARKAGSEVVKQSENFKLSGLIYPLMQALDEEYLKVDVQYGGIDQRKILMYARENLPKIGYKPRVEVMTPLIPGLQGLKMSASDPSSKIDLLDDPETVQQKMKKAYCQEGELEGNGILAFLRYVVMVLKEEKNEPFVVERPAKFGGNIVFHNYQEIESSFINKEVHPLDLKLALGKEISALLSVFQKEKVKLEKIAKEGYA
jgi:tyrosyl-tRNA synthetase